MNLKNLILFTDSYKIGGHWQQYPPKTTSVFSYIESRGCEFSDYIMAFGMQYFLKEYLSAPVTMADVDEADELMRAHGVPFNRSGWEYIVTKHKGMLPVRIKSLKEGSVVPTHSVMLTIENTDPECYWLTSYLETCLMEAVWYPSTVASNSFFLKKCIYDALKKSSDNPEAELPYKLHCFGFRGVSSRESAGIGNAAHLVSWSGTDTLAGLMTAIEYYDSDVCAYSIPASEHSTMTSWAKANERGAYQNMVTQYAAPGKTFACVIDSYDTFGAIDIWADGLFDQVKAKGATVVLRPDSGNPLTMPIDVINAIMSKVGYTVNSKGYKVLPDHIRVIQGDGITIKTIPVILENMIAAGLSMSNLALGMGAGTLQKVDRDTYKMAMKCSHIVANGESIDVFKDPITDPGKRSKKGRLTLVAEVDDGIVTKRVEEVKHSDVELLRVIYDNKPIETAYENFSKIRERANKFLH